MATLRGRLFHAVKGDIRSLQFKQVRLPDCSLFRYSTEVTTSEPRLLDEEIDTDELNQIRDVSRLSPVLKAKLYNEFPPNFGERESDNKKHYRRRIFAKFGSSSNLDPASMWPSKAEMRELIEEQAKYEVPVHVMLEKLRVERETEEEKVKLREQRIKENMKAMPKLIAEFHKQTEQKQLLQKKQEEKKAKLLEEARAYFGYSVDPRDEKFKQMLAEKEAAEKKAAKQQKKAEKMAKVTARLSMGNKES
ncbi:growth arrest and DNA damage-inducible proteins-interacting protein 1 [Octopus bimaculoides]|uniref:Large ribosomal subunit protein mL64 n=1 Tax=Octopus bimaculoides TaxID=37653 RepID=A0A0L8GJT0_OCTBM|nr:growth arrest and DNA damage-inducible proteins-interacting protein 1 [Octopus bimaculoides]|eukprot:XP_014780382.1 PREDICTED: growth arrest and DNA damage-inducible proteins-interacting protein 1-like [Octopus bimaculoides]